jgi:DNA-binding CsgD family transcriptional regulator
LKAVDSSLTLVDCTQVVSAIGEIYAAVENPALWSGALNSLADLIEGQHFILFANYTGSIANDIQATARSDHALWAPYKEHYASVNVWTRRCDRMFPTGLVRYSHHVISDTELIRTEFYDGFLEPNDMAYGFGIEIAIPDQPNALLSAMRSRRHGPFEEKDGNVLMALLPHLQRALRLHFELTALRSAKQGFELALDAFDRAAIGLNGRGKVLFANRTAQQLFAEGDGIRVRNKRLAAGSPAQDTKLQILLQQAAAAGTGFSDGGAILIDRKSGKPPLRLTLMPFAGNMLGHIPELAILVFVDDPAKKPLSRAAVLRAMFGLTPVETRLSELLLQGLEVREAADRLGTTLETTRFHLKRVLAKTGTGRQTELMRLMLTLPGEIGLPGENGDGRIGTNRFQPSAG